MAFLRHPEIFARDTLHRYVEHIDFLERNGVDSRADQRLCGRIMRALDHGTIGGATSIELTNRELRRLRSLHLLGQRRV